MAVMRLQKFLAHAGVCSRRHGEVLIRSGRVKVNGQAVTVLGTKIDPETDSVKVDDRTVDLQQRLRYIALNKPPGYVCTTRRTHNRIVLDLVPPGQRLFPVGRLDKDSCGLVLLTNDGRIHHRLLHPSFDHEKEYDVTVALPIADVALEHMRRGMVILGRPTRPAVVKRMGTKRFRMVLKEGRNRQIRRMVSKLHNDVVTLRRVRMAGITLGRLAEGHWRNLSPAEVRSLIRLLDDRLPQE
jgi:23S rRNA pseudouridine2605 synthase/23S rRNA pseudouridine2604 synthase